MPASDNVIFQIKISLAGARPKIWRRVLIDPMTTFQDLHRIIQLTMGWEACHLHLFQIPGGTLIGDPLEDDEGMLNLVNETAVRFSDVLGEEGQKLKYEYDFGDGWEHEVVLEKVLSAPETGSLPRCIKAVRQCPPEDVGGLHGFYQFLEAMEDAAHPEHVAVRDWLGGEWYEPEFVDLGQINDALANRDTIFAGYASFTGQLQEDVHGLSPDQVYDLLESPLHCPSVFGPVDTARASQALDLAPVIRLLKVLFGAIQDKGIPLTTKGNLPVRQVNALIEAGGEVILPASFRSSFGRVRSEEDVVRVHLIRLLAEISGLTRKYKGKLLLQKATETRVSKGDWLSIYQDILGAAMSQFNWAWLDHYEGLEDIQFVGPFCFWLLAQHGDGWRPVIEYVHDMLNAFPELPKSSVPTPYANPEELTARAIRTRMLTLYQLLGLVELSPAHPEFGEENTQMMRRTPLFESLFSTD